MNNICWFIRLGVIRSDNGIKFAVIYSDHREIKVMTTDEILRKFPEKLIKFLEDEIVFSLPRRSVHFVNNIRLRPIKDNEPLQVIACTNQGDGAMKYLCTLQNNVETIVSSNDAVKQFPKLIIDFLETKIDFNDCMPSPGSCPNGE